MTRSTLDTGCYETHGASIPELPPAPPPCDANVSNEEIGEALIPLIERMSLDKGIWHRFSVDIVRLSNSHQLAFMKLVPIK